MKKTPATADAALRALRSPHRDLNVEIAGLLLDMSVLQPSKPSSLGYKRAAYAIFTLEQPVADLAAPDLLRGIRGIGPSSARIVSEYLEAGRSTVVDAAVAAAPPSKQEDLRRRRQVRDGFLSRASVVAALGARLAPDIVSGRAYRGDLQMHTTWSDGADDLETMAEACIARGWTRMCVTDHSYGLPIARGMSMDHAGRQQAAVDSLNERFAGRFRIIKGIEANVLADGSLDLTAEELARFELVVAAPHSVLRQPHDQTRRMLQAVRTPGVHVLGHPRGRVFNKREGIRADWDRVFAAAAVSGVAIELDGTWDRQDVDAGLAARARDAGCLFAIDTDAHATRELEYVDYGLAHARLAGIPAGRVINCWDDDRLEDWCRSRR
jgi:histidinol phosphatase-like PHP family hydrolase